eukprot:4373025-Pleurochrysis_carterae.AAC.2
MWLHQRARTAHKHALVYVWDLNGLVYWLKRYGPRVLVPHQHCFAPVHLCRRLMNTGGHRGAAAMADRFLQHYFWEEMLTHCKHSRTVATQVIKDPSFPFHTLSIHYKTVTAPKGTRFLYILAIVDKLTRFVMGVPSLPTLAEATLAIS